jgi:ferredoxin
MGKPCIVCEENCPVSPKAIYTQEYFDIIRNGAMTVESAGALRITFVEKDLVPGKLATGDYYCLIEGGQRFKIIGNSKDSVEVSPGDDPIKPPPVGSKIELQIRLQRPYVDIEKCIGCGVCEHECPVSGKKAVRVSAEGETRSSKRKLLLNG